MTTHQRFTPNVKFAILAIHFHQFSQTSQRCSVDTLFYRAKMQEVRHRSSGELHKMDESDSTSGKLGMSASPLDSETQNYTSTHELAVLESDVAGDTSEEKPDDADEIINSTEENIEERGDNDQSEDDEYIGQEHEHQVSNGQISNGSNTKFDLNVFKERIMDLDEELDDMIGTAASSIWGFATSNLQNVGKKLTAATESTQKSSQSFNIGGFKESISIMREKLVSESHSMEQAIMESSAAKKNKEKSNDQRNSEEKDHVTGNKDKATGDKQTNQTQWAMPSLVTSFWKAVKEDESVQNFMGGTKTSSSATTPSASANASVNRFQLKLKTLQGDPDVYCNPVQDIDAFELWAKTFQWQNRTPELEAIFQENPEIKNLYARMVPNYIDESTFWLRYFFAVHQLEMEEQKRLTLLSKVVSGSEDEEDIKWSDDEELNGGDAQVINEAGSRPTVSALEATTFDGPSTEFSTEAGFEPDSKVHEEQNQEEFEVKDESFPAKNENQEVATVDSAMEKTGIRSDDPPETSNGDSREEPNDEDDGWGVEDWE